MMFIAPSARNHNVKYALMLLLNYIPNICHGSHISTVRDNIVFRLMFTSATIYNVYARARAIFRALTYDSHPGTYAMINMRAALFAMSRYAIHRYA